MKLRLKLGLSIACITLVYTIGTLVFVSSTRQRAMQSELQRLERHLVDTEVHTALLKDPARATHHDPLYGTVSCAPEALRQGMRAGRLAPGEMIVAMHAPGERKPVLYRTLGVAAPCDYLQLEPVEDQMPYTQRFGRHLVGRFVVGLLVVLVLWSVLALPIATRLVRTARRAREIIEQDFRGEIQVESRDEIGELASTFNLAAKTARAQLDAEQQSVARMRERLAHLSHDMRTPLSTLKLSVGRLQHEDARVEEILPVMRANLEHLDEMFSNFSLSVQLQDRALQTPTERIDAQAVIERVVTRFAALARDRDLDFHVSIDEDLPGLRIDSIALEQAVGNIVHNAVKFARSQLAIIAYATGDAWRIEVRDDGTDSLPEGLDAPEEEDVLKLHGWGLHITRQIAERYNGRFMLEKSSPDETVATLEFQRESAQ